MRGIERQPYHEKAQTRLGDVWAFRPPRDGTENAPMRPVIFKHNLGELSIRGTASIVNRGHDLDHARRVRGDRVDTAEGLNRLGAPGRRRGLSRHT
jgi:hypothetical protein